MELKREIGLYTQKHAGPLLLITAGLHGNEKAGIIALQNIFRKLNEYKLPIRGTFLGIAGNLKALKEDLRFIDRDMNRIWQSALLKENKNNKSKITEVEQAREILNHIEGWISHEKHRHFHIDIHTTSSESIPYISVSRNKGCQAFADSFPLHDVVGFGQHVKGTIDSWFCKNGFNGFTIESGQHERTSSIENSEVFIWMALVISGCMDMDDIKEFKPSRACLAKYLIDGKKNYNVTYRFAIKEGQDFVMQPNFINFQKISKGELLAHLDKKPVYSEWDARILLPLYQKQGDDGFFIVEEETKEETRIDVKTKAKKIKTK